MLQVNIFGAKETSRWGCASIDVFLYDLCPFYSRQCSFLTPLIRRKKKKKGMLIKSS